jgi:hypothetical protein
MCSITAAAVLISTLFNSDLIAISVCAALLTILIAGRVFGFNETVLLVQHIQAVGTFLKWMPETLRAKFVVVRLEGSLAAGELDLRQKIIKRAKRLDALAIEFACEDVSSGKELAALTWYAPEESPADALQEAPAWELSYTVPRTGDVQTRIRARGRSRQNSGFIWLNPLSELLVALCESWPVDARPSPSGEPAPLQLPRAA